MTTTVEGSVVYEVWARRWPNAQSPTAWHLHSRCCDRASAVLWAEHIEAGIRYQARIREVSR